VLDNAANPPPVQFDTLNKSKRMACEVVNAIVDDRPLIVVQVGIARHDRISVDHGQHEFQEGFAARILDQIAHWHWPKIKKKLDPASSPG
jgi:hypothetical protein